MTFDLRVILAPPEDAGWLSATFPCPTVGFPSIQPRQTAPRIPVFFPDPRRRTCRLRQGYGAQGRSASTTALMLSTTALMLAPHSCETAPFRTPLATTPPLRRNAMCALARRS